MILTSEDAAPHQQMIDGFQQHLELEQPGVTVTFEEHVLHGQSAKTLLDTVQTKPVDMLLTLGSVATQAALKQITQTPIIAGMISQSALLQRAQNATGVVLELPPDVQFEWLQRLLPHSQTIGVLFNKAENQHTIQTAQQTAMTRSLSLLSYAIETPQELPDALKMLTERADVMWGIPDTVALSRHTAKSLLLFSYRNRIPLIGLSTPWAKAGALYALDRDYIDLGKQCGEMAAKILHGTPIHEIPLESPRKVIYAVNLKIAQHMKISLPPALIEGADHVFH